MSETNELDISTLRKERKKEVDNPPLYAKYIKDSKELVENASKLIKKYQTKELTPIKFRKQYMNTNLLVDFIQVMLLELQGLLDMVNQLYCKS